MEGLTWKPERVLKWVLSCKRPKTSKDVAKHFYLDESTAAHYLRLLTEKGYLKVHYQKNRFKYYGDPNETPEPVEKPEPVAAKPSRKKRGDEPVMPNVHKPNKLEDVWGRVVRA